VSKFSDYLKGLRCCSKRCVHQDDYSDTVKCEYCDEVWIPAEGISLGMKEAATIMSRCLKLRETECHPSITYQFEKWLEKSTNKNQQKLAHNRILS